MQPYLKLAVCGVLFCLGLVSLLLPQYVMAVTNWWQVFQEDNFDQTQVQEMVDDALGRRPPPDLGEMGCRVTGGLLIIAAVVVWYLE